MIFSHKGRVLQLNVTYNGQRDFLLLSQGHLHYLDKEAWLRSIMLAKRKTALFCEMPLSASKCKGCFNLLGSNDSLGLPTSWGEPTVLSSEAQDTGLGLGSGLSGGEPNRVICFGPITIGDSFPHSVDNNVPISPTSLLTLSPHLQKSMLHLLSWCVLHRDPPKGSKLKCVLPAHPLPNLPSSTSTPSGDRGTPDLSTTVNNQLIVLPHEFQEPHGILTRARSAILMGKRLGMEYDCTDDFASKGIVRGLGYSL